MKVLEDFKHGNNSIRFLVKKNYTGEKVGKEVTNLEIGDLLVFLVEIHAENDVGLN